MFDDEFDLLASHIHRLTLRVCPPFLILKFVRLELLNNYSKKKDMQHVGVKCADDLVVSLHKAGPNVDPIML